MAKRSAKKTALKKGTARAQTGAGRNTNSQGAKGRPAVPRIEKPSVNEKKSTGSGLQVERKTSKTRAVRGSTGKPRKGIPRAVSSTADISPSDNNSTAKQARRVAELAASEPLPKTRLSAKQLKEFRELLLHKRAQLVGDVEGLTDEALNRKRDGFGENSSMPIHMADLGSDNWEQEFTLGLIENERVRLREIDEALLRIENKTYGICLATHNPISIARLRAKPWATFCIDYARLRDEGRAP